MNPLVLLLALAIDGDTFKIGSERIRLFGIDAPERRAAGGAAATRALQSLLDQGVICEAVDTDRYGRTVAMCFLEDGADIACALVAMGHAEDWPRYSGGRYAACE